jgi:hypothetical protein
VVVALPVRRELIRPAQIECVREYSHLMVKHLGFTALGRGNQVAVQALQDVLADLGELGLDLLAVLLDKSDLGLVALGFLLLLDGCDDPPRGTAGSDHILVSDGKEIPLLDGELLVC